MSMTFILLGAALLTLLMLWRWRSRRRQRNNGDGGSLGDAAIDSPSSHCHHDGACDGGDGGGGGD